MIYSNLMSVADLPGTDVPDLQKHVEFGKQYLPPHEEVFVYGAEARTLNDILIQAGAPSSVDFFSLDVEGVELHVLEGVNHSQFRFKYLLVECRSLPRMTEYLEFHGYRFVETFSEHDFLFMDVR